MDSLLQKWMSAVLKRMLEVRDTMPSWCVICMCGLEPLQFNWFHAAMRLTILWLNSTATQWKRSSMLTCSWVHDPNDCWSAHIISAMDGLTQSYIFKQKLQNCEPINLSRFAVELRERHLKYWTPYSETHPKEHNSKRSTYHQWCALPAYQKGSGHSFASHPSQIHASQPASWCHLQCSSFQTFCSATPYVLRQRLESK